jgi:hypothetical protein
MFDVGVLVGVHPVSRTASQPVPIPMWELRRKMIVKFFVCSCCKYSLLSLYLTADMSATTVMRRFLRRDRLWLLQNQN